MLVATAPKIVVIAPVVLALLICIPFTEAVELEPTYICLKFEADVNGNPLMKIGLASAVVGYVMYALMKTRLPIFKGF